LNTARLISLLNVTALVMIMLSMGLQVKLADVLASARSPRLLVLGVFANYMLMPAVTLGLLYVFGTDPMVSAGFLILAVCPGAPVGPPITAVARGNVHWAVAMMLILAGSSALLSPALLSLLLGRVVSDDNVHINLLAIVRTLLITQLLPLALGLGIHQKAPEFTQRIVKPVRRLANLLLLALFVLILAAQHETLAAIRLRGWTGMSMLLLASLGIGWLCGGRDVATRKATAVTTATRNAAVGLVIAAANFAGTPAVTAVVAYGLVSTFGAIGFAMLLGRYAAIEPASAH
jgi:BASS family bile acid:Na+ symporter